MPFDKRELQDLIFQLIETLHQELHQHERFLGIVRKRKAALGGISATEDSVVRNEKEVLADIVTMERDRIALLTELGQILGRPSPSRMRLAELIFYASPEGRDELLDLREDFRDVADELEALSAVEPAFSRHSVGPIRLYLSPSRLGSLPRERLSHSGTSGKGRQGSPSDSQASLPSTEPKRSVARSGGDVA